MLPQYDMLFTYTDNLLDRPTVSTEMTSYVNISRLALLSVENLAIVGEDPDRILENAFLNERVKIFKFESWDEFDKIESVIVPINITFGFELVKDAEEMYRLKIRRRFCNYMYKYPLGNNYMNYMYLMYNFQRTNMYIVWKIVKTMANIFEPEVDHYFNIITSLPL